MRRAAARTVMALVLGLAASPPAGAQLAPLAAAPSAADLVLRRSDWLALEPLSLADLLRRLAGVAIAPAGGVGSAELLNLAGSTNGRVQLVLDGVEILQPEFEWPRLYGVQVSMIDSIEVTRQSDPARIAIWTRRADSPTPCADFDLGRGEEATRTRRVQFMTPPRAVDVAVSYEELRRGTEDFRDPPGLEVVPGFGSYTGRGVLVRIGLQRGGEGLRLEHQGFEDDTRGSAASQSDYTHTRSTRESLRWERGLGSARLILAVGHQAWERSGQSRGAAQAATDARTHAALDLGLPPLAGWSAWLRLRQANTGGDRAAPDSTHATYDRQGLEVQATRPGDLRCDAWAGASRDARTGVEWHGRVRATAKRGAWECAAQAGRGVAFPGWGEQADVARRGVDAGLRLGRRRAHLVLEATAFAKWLEGGSAGGAFLPAAGEGPSRVAGTLLESTGHANWGPWDGRAQAGLAWFPERRGDPAGLPQVQARFDLRAGRTFRGGDLVVTLLTSWQLDGQREFGAAPPLARSACGDLALDLLLLQRASFFAGLRNLTDTRTDVAPGVALPVRSWWFGLRVRLFD